MHLDKHYSPCGDELRAAQDALAGTANGNRRRAGCCRRATAPAGDDAMHVRIMRERRAPSVQHECGADLRAEMPGIGGDRAQRVGGDVEQQPVDRR